MQLPINIELVGDQSFQNQIFESIRRQILRGQLKPGAPIPSTRILSEQLGVSRNTVVLAYDRLIAEDYIFTQRAVGTFVNANLPDDSLLLKDNVPPDQREEERQAVRHPVLFNGQSQTVINPNRHKLAIDFWIGRPDPRSFPTKAWRRLMLKNLSQAGSNLTEYSDPIGILRLRQAIAEYLGSARGINTAPEQIIIVNGIQEALNLVSRLFIKKGTPVVTECPCYQGAAYVFESCGALLNPIPVDENGLDVSKLPLTRVSLAYVTPSHQYPMGVTLTLERRVRLLDWAWEVGAYIVEDDYDSDFRHHGSPLTAVAGQDRHGCVIYMGTFSKSIGAGLRLGYLVVPGELITPAGTVKALMDNGHSWLDQAILADFISSGSYAKHLRNIRHTYLTRRDCVVKSLREHFGEVSLSGLDGGMHIIWYLPEGFPTAIEVQQRMQRVGVGVYSLEAAAACNLGYSQIGDRALALGYSSVSEEKIREGVARMAAVLSDHCA
ncbi:MAG: PLP-dependent aminotransferase family protein [Gammaproteobacteria bacterium]|nr:PLP-dependent aminotransferase family protein [Gammaproteobacteria bacterium]